MNQIQRDLTYRLDAVKSVCEQHGQESNTCQQAIQFWESQHAMNVFNAQVNIFNAQVLSYTKLIGGVLVVFVLGIILYSWFLKSKCIKDKKYNFK